MASKSDSRRRRRRSHRAAARANPPAQPSLNGHAPLACPVCGAQYADPPEIARVRENFNRCVNLTCLGELFGAAARPDGPVCGTCGEDYRHAEMRERMFRNFGHCVNLTCLQKLSDRVRPAPVPVPAVS